MSHITCYEVWHLATAWQSCARCAGTLFCYNAAS